jgi:hypothetical protein
MGLREIGGGHRSRRSREGMRMPTNKRKEDLEGEDVEGHRRPTVDMEDDVEGHRRPT